MSRIIVHIICMSQESNQVIQYTHEFIHCYLKQLKFKPETHQRLATVSGLLGLLLCCPPGIIEFHAYEMIHGLLDCYNISSGAVHLHVSLTLCY